MLIPGVVITFRRHYSSKTFKTHSRPYIPEHRAALVIGKFSVMSVLKLCCGFSQSRKLVTTVHSFVFELIIQRAAVCLYDQNNNKTLRSFIQAFNEIYVQKYFFLHMFDRYATSATLRPTSTCSRATISTRFFRCRVSARWPSRWARRRECKWARCHEVSFNCSAPPRYWSRRSSARRFRSAFAVSSSSRIIRSATRSSPYATLYLCTHFLKTFAVTHHSAQVPQSSC